MESKDGVISQLRDGLAAKEVELRMTVKELTDKVARDMEAADEEAKATETRLNGQILLVRALRVSAPQNHVVAPSCCAHRFRSSKEHRRARLWPFVLAALADHVYALPSICNRTHAVAPEKSGHDV